MTPESLNKSKKAYQRRCLILFFSILVLSFAGTSVYASYSQNAAATGNQFTTASSFGPAPFDPDDIPEDPVEAQEYYYNYGYIGLETAIGSQSISVQNGGTLTSNIGTNGSVSTGGGVTVCGDMRNGTGNGNQTQGCPTQGAAQGTITLPEIQFPANLASNNSNSRLSGADPVDPSVWQRGNINWNASTRVLRVNYAWLKLQGNLPYFLCRLEISGGAELIVDTSAPAQIFFDNPANCPGVGTNQFVVTGGGKISRTNAIPGFYLKGSTSIATSADFNGGMSINGAVTYAPHTNINFSSGYFYNGAVIGKTLSLSGGGTVQNNLNLAQYPLPIV
jgi:hypothetical protein